MDDREVGRRIAHWRRRRGLTQSLFADRVGKSKSWVEKVEAGTRRASLVQLDQIAAVLRIDLGLLIRQDRPPADANAWMAWKSGICAMRYFAMRR